MRSLTLGTQQQLTATYCRPALFCALAFADQTVYAWTGVGPISWNGCTWLGVGNLATVSPVAEGSDTTAQGITIGLTGVPTSLLNEGLGQMQAGKRAQLYLGFVDAAGNVIPDPVPLFNGFMDQPTIDISTSEAAISFAIENRMADLQRSRGGRYTDQDQRARCPNDGSLQYVAWLQDQFVNWKG